MTSEKQGRIIGMIRQGMTYRKIASELDIGLASVARAVRAAKMTRAARAAEILRLRKAGDTYQEIADAVGCSVGTVQTVLQRERLTQPGLSGITARRAALEQVGAQGNTLAASERDDLVTLSQKLDAVDKRNKLYRRRMLDLVCEEQRIRELMRKALNDG